MIITHLSAENLLKYKSLELNNLPREGVITISGQNESGKSTIGETVCFALFGRTFSLADEEIDRVIRWGEARCSVRLGFSVSGIDYEIARFLDNEGNQGARLYLSGEENNPLAKGITAVNEAMYELLGYQFEEFVESFYLAQREITTPHPHSHAIKTMAGIAALETVAEDLAFEVKYENSRLPELSEQLDTVAEDIKALAIEPGKLEGLESQFESISAAGETLNERQEGLSKTAKDYATARRQIRSAQTMKSLSGIFGLFSLIAAAAMGISWYLYNKLPGSLYTDQLTSTLEQYIPGWSEQSATLIPQLAPATGAISVLFLLLWLMSHTMKKKISALLENGEAMADQLISAQEAVPGLLVNPDEPATGDSTENGAETASSKTESESVNTETEANENAVNALALSSSEFTSIRRCKLNLDRINKLVKERQDQLQLKMAAQQKMQGSIEYSISQEKNRLDKGESLGAMQNNLQEKMNETQHRIMIREMADELISAAGRHFSQTFNKDLRELASRTLPLFTEGRYEHLNINNDLNVRAFSSLKRDYMDLDEISSGTQRQIMLAVRLALSQELVNTTDGGKQFIFLDEPFAFFDETRTRNAMAILPELSEEIRQVWVIAQSFPEDTKNDLNIVCSREFESLAPQPG
jgi:exonuclease SbcC